MSLDAVTIGHSNDMKEGTNLRVCIAINFLSISVGYSLGFSTYNGMSTYRLCGLVVSVPGYRSKVRVQFLALPDFLRSSGSGTVSSQPREYN
jgi:hypothetical protein